MNNTKKTILLTVLLFWSQISLANTGAEGVALLVSFILVMANVLAIFLVWFSMYLRIKYKNVMTIFRAYFFSSIYY